jgi:cell division protein FtsI/penicillin-binding protein 2
VANLLEIERLQAMMPEQLTIDEWNTLIEYEERKWERVGMTPNAIGVDHFTSNLQLLAVMDFLVEKGIMTEEEFDKKFLKKKYETLKEIRENIQGEILKQRLTQGIHQPLPPMRK